MAPNKVIGNKREGEDFKQVNRKLQNDKEFKIQNSLLTDLWETNGGKTVYNIFIASFIGLLVQSLVKDIMEGGEIKSGFWLVYYNFGKFHVVLLSLVGFNLLTVSAYFCFSLWTHFRINLIPNSRSMKYWDLLWLFTFTTYFLFSFSSAKLIVANFNLPPASAVTVLLEQIRLLMKTYAFIRHSVPKVLKYKPHNGDTLKIQPFSKFAYFLYAPTFFYKDEYPRTKTIRWNFVACRLTEIAVVIFYLSFLSENTLIVYKDFGLRKYTWSEVVTSFFGAAVFGLLAFVTLFYVILHCVQNIGAELLRFGDRMFYLDWWSCTSIPEYFRKWNLLVNDWLYINIYKDAYEASGSKTVATLALYIISGLVHEWVLFSMLGYFMPLCITVYLLAVLVSFVTSLKSAVTNVLFWYMGTCIFGNFFVWYVLEYYARVNVPVSDSTLRNYFLPWWITLVTE